LGQDENARTAFQKCLDIRERLAQAEPDRADYQGLLAISLARMGTVSDGADARQWLQRAVQIRRAVLVLAPDDAMLKRELATVLLQYSQAASDTGPLVEAATILVELRRSDTLEAEYHGLADQLTPLVNP